MLKSGCVWMGLVLLAGIGLGWGISAQGMARLKKENKLLSQDIKESQKAWKSHRRICVVGKQ